ncbi:hypothetical protein MTO96_032475 [Rhipicephalus appendiculatus]
MCLCSPNSTSSSSSASSSRECPRITSRTGWRQTTSSASASGCMEISTGWKSKSWQQSWLTGLVLLDNSVRDE